MNWVYNMTYCISKYASLYLLEYELKSFFTKKEEPLREEMVYNGGKTLT